MSPSHSGARTALRGVCCAAALSLALTACGSDSGSSDSAQHAANTGPCATTSTSGAKGVSLLPVTPAEVTVTDAGTGPRRLLAATANTVAAQQVTLTTTSTEARAGAKTEQTVTMPLTARIGCADPTDVELSLGAVTSPDADLAQALQAEHDALAGMSLGPGTMPISLRIIAPDAASSQARSAVEQALVQTLMHSVPFPTTPVGQGATWRVVRTLTGAATTTLTIDATLRSRTDDTVVVEVSLDESPINDVFSVPGTTQTLRIARYTMTGTGTLTMDLQRALPSSGTITMHGARELEGNGDQLLQEMGLSVTYASRS